MKINLIIFDFDGTLFDTKEDITASVNFALKQCNIDPVSSDLVWGFTGDGTPVLIRRVLGEANKDCVDKVLQMSLDYYSEHFANFTKPVDDVEAFLRRFEDKRKTILSNKYKSLINKIIHKFGFEKYFSEIFGRDSFKRSKPDPYPIFEIMKMFKSDIASTLYIGDSINDIILSKNAKIKCFIIPSGVSDEDDLRNANPDLIFRSYKELENIIE
jgi:phosphoglycolate phosphatase